MSVRINSVNSDVFISASDVLKATKIVRDEVTHRCYIYCDACDARSERLRKGHPDCQCKITDVLEYAGFTLSWDKQYNIVGIHLEEGYYEEVLDLLSPFMREGSAIEMEEECGGRFRYVVNEEGEIIMETGRVVYD